MRQALLDAAAELFAERGYSATTVQAVAARAGCAAGSVYNHFDGKEALLHGLLERWQAVESAKVGLGSAASADFRAFVRGWVEQRTDALAEHESLARSLLSEMLVRPELREIYRERLLGPRLEAGGAYLRRVGQRSGRGFPEPDLAARLLLGAVMGLGLLRLLGEPAVTERWDECRRMLAELLLDGMPAPEIGSPD